MEKIWSYYDTEECCILDDYILDHCDTNNIKLALEDMAEHGLSDKTTAKNIHSCVISCQKKCISLNSNYDSDDDVIHNLDKFSKWNGDIEENTTNYRVDNLNDVIITMKITDSLFLENIESTSITVKGRCSRIMIINCNNLDIKCETPPVCDIYVYSSSRITLDIPNKSDIHHLGSFGVELSNDISLKTGVIHGFQLTSHYSFDVNIVDNDDKPQILVNAFSSTTWRKTENGKYEIFNFEKNSSRCNGNVEFMISTSDNVVEYD